MQSTGIWRLALVSTVFLAAGSLPAHSKSCFPKSKNGQRVSMTDVIAELYEPNGGAVIKPQGCKIDIVLSHTSKLSPNCKVGATFTATGDFEACLDADCEQFFGDSLFSAEITCK